jgi:hypothetical protein
MERCHARKSKIHSNIFEITVPFEVGSSMLNVRSSDYLKGAASAAYIGISKLPVTE